MRIVNTNDSVQYDGHSSWSQVDTVPKTVSACVRVLCDLVGIICARGPWKHGVNLLCIAYAPLCATYVGVFIGKEPIVDHKAKDRTYM